MHTQTIKTLKGCGWKLTMHDVGIDQAEMVLAVKVNDAVDLWYLSQDCALNDLLMGAVFMTADNIVYFPLFVLDSDDYKAIME